MRDRASSAHRLAAANRIWGGQAREVGLARHPRAIRPPPRRLGPVAKACRQQERVPVKWTGPWYNSIDACWLHWMHMVSERLQEKAQHQKPESLLLSA